MTEKLNSPIEYTVTHIVAQKRHSCCECRGHIEKLDVYEHYSGRWVNSRQKIFRTCGHCEQIRDWLLNETDWPGIAGTPYTFNFRQLRQHLIQLSRTGDRAFRFRALRCVVEMKRRCDAAKAAK